MPEDALHTSHEWVRWLSGVDATTLLLNLCQHIDTPHVTKDALVTLVHQWRANALEALQADDWKASVDKYLEVTADARLYLLSQGKL
jgi:hypothetical protein